MSVSKKKRKKKCPDLIQFKEHMEAVSYLGRVIPFTHSAPQERHGLALLPPGLLAHLNKLFTLWISAYKVPCVLDVAIGARWRASHGSMQALR